MNKTDLIQKVKALEGLTQDERAYLINLVNTKKKYGLVWEDKPEEVEEQLRAYLPVLKEIKDKAIINGEEHPNHILIEGDNLHALTALTFTHEGKIDVIYIDPPYNTGNKDFKYNDTFVDKEDSYRHSKWLSFMNKRLKIAKRLLKDSGVIFISIDDNEISQLKLLCDEIFNETNFISQLTLVNNIAGRSDKKHIAQAHEYVLMYQKTIYFESTGVELGENLLKEYKFNDKIGKYRLQGLRKRGANSRREDRPNLFYPIYFNPEKNELSLDSEFGSVEILPKLSDGNDGNWRWGKSTFLDKKHLLIAKISNKKYEIFEKVYFENNGEEKTTKMKSFLYDSDYTTDTATTIFKSVIDKTQFNNPKSTLLIQDLVKIATPKKNGVILDFFAGSGTTMHSTLNLNNKDNGNRQCILVTNNENNICEEVTYERNKKVIQGYANAKGVEVEGLTNNNLRYYKSEFVSREPSLKIKRELTQLATELLCIKEDCYTEQKINIKQARLFANSKVTLLILFDDHIIPQAVEFIKGIEAPEIKVYVFSMGSDPYTEDFAEVLDKVTLCALPDAIYKAYQNVLPRKQRLKLEVTDDNDNKDESGRDLFSTNDESTNN